MFSNLSSFILTLVLIYILIAIMCDTFDSVLSQEMSAFNYERAQLIYKYEKRMTPYMIDSFRKQGAFEKYLFIVDCMVEESLYLADGAVRDRILKLEKLMENQSHQLSEIEAMNEKVAIVDSVQNKLD